MKSTVVLWLAFAVVACGQVLEVEVKPGKETVIDLGKRVKTPDGLRGFPGGKDLTPPTDRLSDAINRSLKAEAGNSNVKPVLVTRNEAEAVRMAKSIGKPVIFYFGFWPDQYTGTTTFFEELSEALHVIVPANVDQVWERSVGFEKTITREPANTECVIWRHRDGGLRFTPAHTILNGQAAARGLRLVWEGERKPQMELGDPARLTTAERDAVLASTVTVFLGGREERMTVRECVSRGGRMTVEMCERMGLNPDEAAFAVGLAPTNHQGMTHGMTGYSGSGFTTNAGRTYSGGSTFRPAAPAPPAMRSPPAPVGRFSGPIRGG